MARGAPAPSSRKDLCPKLQANIASFLPRNEIACTLRLINKATAEQFRDWINVKLSQSVPQHAFAQRWGSPNAIRHLPLQQRQRLLALTARSGNSANLQLAFATAGCSLVQEVFDAAAAGGSQEVAHLLADMRCPIGGQTVAAAASTGNLQLVRLLLLLKHRHQHQSNPNSQDQQELVDAAWAAASSAGLRALCVGLLADGRLPSSGEAPLSAAARGGHVRLTEWLLQLPQLPRGPRGLDKAWLLTDAAWGFDLPSLQRLCCAQKLRPCSGGSGGNPHGNGAKAVGRIAAAAAAAALASPTPDWRAKVQWLLDKEDQEAKEGAKEAGGAGLLATLPMHFSKPLDWAQLLQRPDWRERMALLLQEGTAGLQPQLMLLSGAGLSDLVTAAVRAAYLPTLLYLRDQGLLPPSALHEDHASIAAGSGDLALLTELLVLGCPLGRGAPHAAAWHGHLHVLRWLAGPLAGPAGGETALQQAAPFLTSWAAQSGGLEAMRWLRARGCTWTVAVFNTAAETGNAELLEWLVAEGCPMSKAAQLAAARNGDTATLRCLRRLGCPWDQAGRTFSYAVDRGCRLGALRCLRALGCPADWREARQRAATLLGPGEVLAWIEGQLTSGAAGAGASNVGGAGLS